MSIYLLVCIEDGKKPRVWYYASKSQSMEVMYRLNHEGKKCYVYCADISKLDPTTGEFVPFAYGF